MSQLIFAPCPACGMPTEFKQKDWMDACLPDETLNRRKERPTVPTEIMCGQCKAVSPTADWHRSYERAVFKHAGWTTPRMEKQRA